VLALGKAAEAGVEEKNMSDTSDAVWLVLLLLLFLALVFGVGVEVGWSIWG